MDVQERDRLGNESFPDVQRRRVRGLAPKLLLAAVSSLLSIVLVEGLLWLQEPYFNLLKERAEWNLGRSRPHSIWHHWLRPNQLTAWQLPYREYPQPVITRTNAQGCRDDRALSARPSAGTRRIIVLGDSYTEGYYDEQTFARILERRLNEQPGPTRFEVINCGTSSYSPILHYLRYAQQLRGLAPHELIVNIDLTDVFDDNERYGPGAVFGESGEPLRAGDVPSMRRRLADALRYRFRTARLILGRPAESSVPPISAHVFRYYRETAPHSEEWEQHVAFSLRMLTHLIDLTQRDGVQLALTMYPYETQLTRLFPGDVLWNRDFEQRVRELAEKRNVRFYSAYDDLRPLYEQNAPLYWDDDFHFSPVGQQAWGEGFADVTSRSGWRTE